MEEIEKAQSYDMEHGRSQEVLKKLVEVMTEIKTRLDTNLELYKAAVEDPSKVSALPEEGIFLILAEMDEEGKGANVGLCCNGSKRLAEITVGGVMARFPHIVERVMLKNLLNDNLLNILSPANKKEI